jgi:hypothetical protein
MDPWKELAAREECCDRIRAWAELESKSAQMAADLIQRHAPLRRRPPDWRLMLGFGVRLAAWVYETWSHITRR